MVILLQTNFLYDPARGNLLVDVLNYSASSASPVAGQGAINDGASRVTGSISSSSGNPDTGADAIKFVCTPQTNWTGIVISVQPPSLARETEQSASFEATAFSYGPLQYLWRHNGNPLPGQTNASLLLAHLQVEQSGTYQIEVSNLAGYVTNASAQLQVTLPATSAIVPNSLASNDVAYGAGTFRAANYRHQQVYAASAFPSPLRPKLIRELRWRPDYVYGNAFTTTLAQVVIRLSTTPKQPDGLSGVFAQNPGADETVVFSGPITLSSRYVGPPNGPKEFDIAIPLQTNFFYSPVNGNLLVDVLNYNASTVSPVAGQGVGGDGASRLTGLIPNTSGSADTGADAIKFVFETITNWVAILVSIEPSALWREAGDSARFDAVAVGQGPIQYSWRHNGNPLTGETNASLSLSNLQVSQAGTYEVVVSNPGGFVTNATAQLFVMPIAPGVVLPAALVSNDVAFGSSTFRTADFRVQQVYAANGFSTVPGPKVIQELRWRPDYNYGNAFTSTLAQLEIRLSTTQMQPEGLSGIFASNRGADESVVFSGPITLSSHFVGPPNGPKLFDIIIPFQTNFFYLPAAGNLLVDIRNAASSGASLLAGQGVNGDGASRVYGSMSGSSGTVNNGADVIKFVCETLTNWTGIVLKVEPAGLSREEGDSARFEAIAYADGPVQYSWRHNGNPLFGQTNASLSLSNVQVNQSGTYEVVVSNLAGSVTNATAQLNVADAPPSVVLPGNLVSNDVAFGSATVWASNYRVQMVYAASGFSAFKGPLVIRELRWRPNYVQGKAFNTTALLLGIRLSTTQKNPDGLSPFFADNTGPDQTEGFLGAASISSEFAGPTNGPKRFDIKIPLQRHFVYRPSRGNLLVDVANYDGAAASWVAGQSVNGDGASRLSGAVFSSTGTTDTGTDAIKFIVGPPTNTSGVIVFLEPESPALPAGETVQFEAFAYGEAPFQFAWRHNGNAIAGETNAALTLTNVQVGDSGSYEVIVRNGSGVTTNATAQMVVTNVPAGSVIRGPYLQCLTTSNVIVRWRSDVATYGSVRFGLTPESQLWECAHGEITSEHLVTLTNLAPGTRYFYGVWSRTNLLDAGTNNYVQTAPVARAPTRIWAIGDAGTTTRGSTIPAVVRDAYLQSSQGCHTDVWLMLGDNAYNSGSDTEFQIAVFDVFASLLRKTAVWPTIGNHEAGLEGGQGPGPHLDNFSLPKSGQAGGIASGSELYYSFNHGNIHFVCLDSEVSGKRPGNPQLIWLEQDLAANTNDWVIAFWHSPPYSRGSHSSDGEQNLIQMREFAVPILENYGVDLVLCGHSHSYERSFLMDGHYGYSTSLTPSMIKDGGSGRTNDTGAYRKPSTGPAARQGAVYVVAGSAGQRSGVYSHPAMFMSLHQYGSVVIDIDGDRLDARFLRETGAVDDHFTILKGAAAEPLYIATFRASGGTVTAKWKSVAGRVYRIESTLSLASAQWSLVVDNIMATGATTSWSGPADSPTGSAYYRVVQVSP